MMYTHSINVALSPVQMVATLNVLLKSAHSIFRCILLRTYAWYIVDVYYFTSLG